MTKILHLPELKILMTMLMNNTKMSEICRALDIKKSCVYNYMNKFEIINYDRNRLGECLKKRGPKHKDNSIRNAALSEIIAEDNSLVQFGMQLKLRERDISVSQATIVKILKDISCSRKRLTRISDKKNDEETINMRQQFAIRYRNFDNTDLIYLDETGFNLHTTRSYGYSPINSPARITVKSSKGKNVTLLALICNARV